MNIFRREMLLWGSFLAVSALAAPSKAKKEHLSPPINAQLPSERAVTPNVESAPGMVPAPTAPVAVKEEWKWDRRIGLQVAILYPTPGGLGVGLNYRYDDNLRFGVGFGTVIWYTTVGVNAKYLFVPEWSFRPFAGVQLNRTDTIVDDLFDAVANNIAGTTSTKKDDPPKWHGAFDVGFDYLAVHGFNFGIGASFIIGDSGADNTVYPFTYLG